MYLFCASLTSFVIYSVYHYWELLKDYYNSWSDCVHYGTRLRYTSSNTQFHKDITDLLPDESTTIDPSSFPLQNPLVEIRYLYQGKKYRIISDKPIKLPVEIEITNDNKRRIKKALLVPSMENVTAKVRKYHGANRDYHGRTIDWNWVFGNNGEDELHIFYEDIVHEIMPLRKPEESDDDSDTSSSTSWDRAESQDSSVPKEQGLHED